MTEVTRRDYFAASAVQGLIEADAANFPHLFKSHGVGGTIDIIAELAVRVADRVIEELDDPIGQCEFKQ